MGLFSKLREKAEKSAQGLFEKSPFLYSHLPESVKRGAWERDLQEAEEAAKRVTERTAQITAKRTRIGELRAESEGLHKQLTDTEGRLPVHYGFADTNRQSYRKYVR